jgi:hypothetical protein
MDFKIFQILSQNPNLLAFGFIVKYQFVAKTDRNSIFLDREAHIPDQLYIIVMYISFKGLKKTDFASKSKGVGLQLYRKVLVIKVVLRHFHRHRY